MVTRRHRQGLDVVGVPLHPGVAETPPSTPPPLSFSFSCHELPCTTKPRLGVIELLPIEYDDLPGWLSMQTPRRLTLSALAIPSDDDDDVTSDRGLAGVYILERVGEPALRIAPQHVLTYFISTTQQQQQQDTAAG